MKLEGTKGPLVTRKSSRTSFGYFEPLLGLFWSKNGCFLAQKIAQIWKGTSRLGATAPGRHW